MEARGRGGMHEEKSRRGVRLYLHLSGILAAIKKSLYDFISFEEREDVRHSSEKKMKKKG